MPSIFLVVLNDEPVEIQSAWNTREEADGEITRQLDAADVRGFYWLQVRLNVTELPIGIVPELLS